jgi:hypothetical protein
VAVATANAAIDAKSEAARPAQTIPAITPSICPTKAENALIDLMFGNSASEHMTTRAVTIANGTSRIAVEKPAIFALLASPTALIA